jgi:hypothetical protein
LKDPIIAGLPRELAEPGVLRLPHRLPSVA